MHDESTYKSHLISSQRYIVYSVTEVLYSGFYLRGPNFCEFCEVLASLQILILKQLFFLSHLASTVNVLTHNTHTGHSMPNQQKTILTTSDFHEIWHRHVVH